MKVTSVEIDVEDKIYKIENSGKNYIEFRSHHMDTRTFSSYGDPDKIARIIHSRIFGNQIIGFDMEFMLILSIVSMLMDG